jgi:7-cyano-7-deazaguanine synthase
MSPTNTLTILHLLSGGLDSVVMLHDLVAQGHRVHSLLFDYKQRHRQELEFAKYHARVTGTLFTVVDLPNLGGLTEASWIVPNRNAIFISVAANVAHSAGADTITIGCNKDDEENFPDCRKGFLQAMQTAVTEAGYKIQLCAPYIDKRKWEIGDMARQMGITSSQIWTCYQGGAKPCGECPACAKLREAKL